MNFGNGQYEAWRKICREKITPDTVIQMVEASGLCGRGGAGFPTATKWRFLSSAQAKNKFVVCNGDEGDPGAFMDRAIMEQYPHILLEAMRIAGYAVGV